MRLLLDTQIFLWFISGDERLSATVRNVIVDTDNLVSLSVVSVWEALIKYELGKLPLPESPEIYLPRQREGHLIESLPITESSLKHLAGMPKIHRDPFDRCLISQAMAGELTLVTVDAEIQKYEVSVLN